MADIEIKNAKSLASPWTRWFFYGPTGSGKTTAAGTFPRPFFIVPQNEKSIVSLMGDDIDYTEVSNRAEMSRVLSFLQAKHDKAEKLFVAGKADAAWMEFPWETIVVESLSHYCELLIEDIGRRGANKMDMQAWGMLSSHLRTVHSQLGGMDVHVVYTSLESTDDAGNGRPLMTGKNALMMPSACDVICFMQEVPVQRGKDPIYRAHFRAFGRYPARSRLRGFPPSIDNFHFDDIRELLGLPPE